MQVTSLDYSSFLGRIAVGKVARGTIAENMWVGLAQEDGKILKGKVKNFTFSKDWARKSSGSSGRRYLRCGWFRCIRDW